jgi:hypothetical protein
MKNRSLIEVHGDPVDADGNTEEANFVDPHHTPEARVRAEQREVRRQLQIKNEKKEKQQKAVSGPPRAVLGSLKSVPGQLTGALRRPPKMEGSHFGL